MASFVVGLIYSSHIGCPFGSRKAKGLVAPNHGAGDQGLVSVVDDPRPEHFDLICFAKAQFLVTKKSRWGNMHLERAVIGVHHEVGSDVAADRTVKLLHVLHYALYGLFVGGAVNRHPMPRAGKQQNCKNQNCSAHSYLWNSHSTPLLFGLVPYDRIKLPQLESPGSALVFWVARI